MTSKYIGETLHYMGAHTDNSFLTSLPNYKNYVLYDAQPNSNYFNIPKDEFINKLIKKFGPIKKMRDENTIEFEKVVSQKTSAEVLSQRTISIVYHINFDCEEEFDISDGDLFVSGYYPDWIENYDFLGRKVYVGCSTVFRIKINSFPILIESNVHPDSCACKYDTINHEDLNFDEFVPTSETLFYLGAWYNDNHFLQIFPTYKIYHIYNRKEDIEYHKLTKDKLIEKLIKFYGPITEIISEDTLKFGKIIYHINFDCNKEFDIYGDVYINGFVPDWYKTYDFKGRNVYYGCSNIIYEEEVNSEMLMVKSSEHFYRHCLCYDTDSEDEE